MIAERVKATLGDLLRRPVFWLGLGALLLLFMLQSVSWRASLRALGRLSGVEILLLLLANGLVIFILAGRWWLICRALGVRLTFMDALRIWLGGAAVSYFTPGPQFGGEPLQIMMLTRRHGASFAAATAAVVVDKTLTLLINLSFLILGLLYFLASGLAVDLSGRWGAAVLGGILAWPVFLLAGWFMGRRPLAWLVGRSGWLRAGRGAAAGRMMIETEEEVRAFCRTRPAVLAAAAALSLLGWLFMIGEYWLMARFVGLPLDGRQALLLLTAVRLSWLLPVPTGLGTLEAAQIYVLTLVGLPAYQALGVSLSLLIRLRDVATGLLGLWLAGLLGRKRKRLASN